MPIEFKLNREIYLKNLRERALAMVMKRIEELKSQLADIRKVLDDYKNKTEEELWLGELEEFETSYKVWVKELAEEQEKEDKLNIKNGKDKKVKKDVTKKKK